MDSDSTLAKVTYLPGVVPSPTHVQEQGETTTESAVLSESVASPERTAPAERVLRRAENISVNALTRKGRSRWELGQVLLARELDPSVVEAELDRLEGVGLIDDAALAENIVRTQHERKGLGRAALMSEMRRKHIDPSVIEAALEPLGVDEEFTRALQLAERRAGQLLGLDHTTAVRRLSGYLQRRGYTSDTARRAVLEALPRPTSGVRFS